jgi:uncharacterized membrane protein YgcG
LSPLAKLGQSTDLSKDIKEGRSRNNKEIIASFEKIQTMDEIHYRKTRDPWDLIPRFAKRRVADMCGILTSEHRMEIEQTIDKMQGICDVDLYVVIVPTVGYVTPRAFSNSLFYNWAIGEPNGNGLLLVITLHEATVELVSSAAIEEYFDKQFLEPAVMEIYQPLVREGNPSYATVQLVYAIARHAHEVRDLWKRSIILSVPARNKVRQVGKVIHHGVIKVPYLLMGSILFICCTVVLITQVLDTICPDCGAMMHRVNDPLLMQSIMSKGQYLEHKNECAYYRVWKCPRCQKGTNVVLISRDLHQHDRCLKCTDCEYYTCNLRTSVEKLPSRHEDGVKKLLYQCENCRIGREIFLPLYRPIDTKPDGKWFEFLLERSGTHKQTKVDLKL